MVATTAHRILAAAAAPTSFRQIMASSAVLRQR